MKVYVIINEEECEVKRVVRSAKVAFDLIESEYGGVSVNFRDFKESLDAAYYYKDEDSEEGISVIVREIE